MTKELIGIGANPTFPEGHVHLVAKGPGKSGLAWCDKRTTGLEPSKSMTAADVTCKKCMTYAAFKDMIDPSRVNKSPDTVGIPTAKPKPEGKKSEPKKKPAAKKKAEPAKKKEPPKKKSKPKKKVEPYVDFAAVPNKDGTYKIKHIPSGRNFFDSVPASVIAFALEAINSLEDRWAGEDKTIPEGYVTTIRDTLKRVYKDRKVKAPKHLTRPLKKQKKKKPPKLPKGVKIGDRKKSENNQWVEFNGQRWVNVQKITRRKKPAKEKRVIRRRGKSPDTSGKRQIKRREPPAGLNQYGQVMDKPPALIAAHLQNGVHLNVVIQELKDKFGMTEKRAHSKFRAITRKMARRLGIKITHILMGDPSNDFYHIADED